ncbi:MAG: DNA polymerase domain-containing protein [Candidatus Hodarchaeales archaeon]
MKKSIEFILLDADYDISFVNGEKYPIIRLWGRKEGKKVEVRVKGFYPYFYVEGSKSKINNSMALSSSFLKEHVHKIKEIEKSTYFLGRRTKLSKISCFLPYQVTTLRKKFLEKGFRVHEADIPFARRFLIDSGVRALHYVEVNGKIVRQDEESVIVSVSYKDVRTVDRPCYYQPLILAFDIEVAEEGETIQELLMKKIQRITAISFSWGLLGEKNFKSEALLLEQDTDKDEKKLLVLFLERVSRIRPDVFVSFNGTFFDIPYLQARLKKYKLSLGKLAIFGDLQEDVIKTSIPVESYRLKGRAVVDLLPKTWSVHPISGKKDLDSIVEHMFGEKKVETGLSLGELWRKGISGDTKVKQLFYDYSLKDAMLTFRLASEVGLSNSVELCRLAGYPLPEGLLSTSRNIGEFELMRILYSKNIIIPNKPGPSEIKKRKALKRKYPHLGGWVLEPEVSEATFVAILDFRSLYPNIVRQHNISGETLIQNSATMDPENRFKVRPKGALAELMDRILKERYSLLERLNELKTQPDYKTSPEYDLLQKKQKSLKLMANSVVGAANYPRGRFYHHLLSNTITSIARSLLRDKLLTWTEEFSKTNSIQAFVRYGDTDSIFVEFKIPGLKPGDFAVGKEKNPELYNKLNYSIKEYQFYLSKRLPEFLELKLEDIALRIILKKGRKKAYAYLSLNTQKVVIKGFEAVRSDWSPIARRTQKTLLETLLKDFSHDRILNAKRLILKICFRILNDPQDRLLSDLTIRGPIKRSPKAYRSKTKAMGAFLHYCEEKKLDPTSEWKNWDGFPYIIANEHGKHPQYFRAYHPDTFKKQKRQIDRIHYIKEILGASKRFGIEISISEVRNRALVVPLSNFFPKSPSN